MDVRIAKHAPGYPTREHLLVVTTAGRSEFGTEGMGSGNFSEGSQRIIRVVDEVRCAGPTAQFMRQCVVHERH